MSNYKIRVYDWNPNGTNDISIVNSCGDFDVRFEDSLQDALFGVNINKIGIKYDDNSSIISLKDCLKYIAVSPVEDGSSTIKFLKKYFKSIK